MVPVLARIVEERAARGLAHDRLEPLVRPFGAIDQLVQRVDVFLVVLAVMEFQRLGRNVRRQSVGSVGKLG